MVLQGEGMQQKHLLMAVHDTFEGTLGKTTCGLAGWVSLQDLNISTEAEPIRFPYVLVGTSKQSPTQLHIYVLYCLLRMIKQIIILNPVPEIILVFMVQPAVDPQHASCNTSHLIHV
jgi:hypothetical protein